MDMSPGSTDNIVTAPFDPAPLARAILFDRVLHHKYRLIPASDQRMGPLARTFTMAAGILVGPTTSLIGFIDAGRNVTQEEIAALAGAAAYWAIDRLNSRVAQHVDMTFVILGQAPVSTSPPPPQTNVHLSIFAIDQTTTTVTTVLSNGHASPNAHELASVQRRVNKGDTIPTLAAIDLAEHQIMRSSTAGIQSSMVSPSHVLQARAWVTYGFIASWVVIYILEITLGAKINGSNSALTLAEFGALTNQNGGAVDWWRFLTSAFVHDNTEIFHVLFNCLGMFFVGSLVERLYGKLWLATVFFVSAVAGSALWYFTASPETSALTGMISFGASGGILGMLGILATLGVVQGKALPHAFVSSIRNQAIFWALLNIFINFTGNTNLVAHFGGAIAGFAIGMIAAPKIVLAGRNMTLYEKVFCCVVIVASGITLLIGIHSAVNLLSLSPGQVQNLPSL